MTASLKVLLIAALLSSLTYLPEASAGKSTIENGRLYVPRIDVDGYGALALEFRIIFENEYLLLLESANETAMTISNSGVFDPDRLTIDVDEVELESGDVYAIQLSLVSQDGPIIFSIAAAQELDAQQPTDSPAVQATYPAHAPDDYSQQCAGCHAVDGTGGNSGPSLLACANCSSSSALASYIENTMPLGQAVSCNDTCANALAAYILAEFNASNQQTAGETVSFIQTLGNTEALRKSAEQLLSRLPSLQEQQMVSVAGLGGLKQAIDGMMEEPAFYSRLTEIFNDYLLTDKYHSRNGSEAAINLLSSDDFPERRWFDPDKNDRDEGFEQIRRNTNDGVAREPLALINYVVKNNRPFTEILTADYMMMNSFSARSYGVQGLNFADPDDADEFQPARLEGVPHAGILTSPMFLNRYPTTSTNRNRGRSRVVFDLLLDTDILAIEGVRPGNAVDITTPIPTINNPQCSKCHTILDPVASVFQNWDYKGRYRPARLERYGWYTDMESRGFNGISMPLASNVDSSVQWLSGQIAADPKFPRAITRILINGLTGREPLKAPVEGSTPQELDAYITQRTLLNELQGQFVADGFNLKTLVREIMLSPYFRADGLSEGANVSVHALTGASYLLSPEQLDRKIINLFGFDWRNSLDSYYKDRDRSYASKLNNTFHQIYGGIDSDSITTRLSSPNGMMAAMQIRMANELACYATANDFWMPQSQRKLFLFVDHETSPYNEAGVIDDSAMEKIRQNIQYLHKYLLGEDLGYESAEFKVTEELFMAAMNRGRQLMIANAGEWYISRLPDQCDRVKDFEGNDLRETDSELVEDRQYVIRAWMAVLAYLLSDYKFLYS